MNKQYLLAFIPGIIGFTMEFFSKEILTSGFNEHTLSIITQSLRLASLIALLYLYYRNRKKK